MTEPSSITTPLVRTISRLASLILAILREIGDETAYHRHLAAHGAQPSGPEWRRFSEERMRNKYARAKCC
jgi:hypothetical protein